MAVIKKLLSFNSNCIVNKKIQTVPDGPKIKMIQTDTLKARVPVGSRKAGVEGGWMAGTLRG